MDYGDIQRVTGMDIFESRGDSGAFKFVIPGTALWSHDIKIVRRDHKWHLTCKESGQEFAGSAEDLTGAYLALIADVLGLIAVVTTKSQDDL